MSATPSGEMVTRSIDALTISWTNRATPLQSRSINLARRSVMLVEPSSLQASSITASSSRASSCNTLALAHTLSMTSRTWLLESATISWADDGEARSVGVRQDDMGVRGGRCGGDVSAPCCGSSDRSASSVPPSKNGTLPCTDDQFGVQGVCGSDAGWLVGRLKRMRRVWPTLRATSSASSQLWASAHCVSSSTSSRGLAAAAASTSARHMALSRAARFAVST
mmetsp:Transcript_32177/g.73702  ORF Transcript_32177/g.73702 Transcript_32177/m.73702 type:complete len:223 (-) Transcript_32177:816-1484(-)